MKLNPNCIRDILITIEEQSDFTHLTDYRIHSPFKSLSKYTHNEILYHIRQCEQSCLISGVHYYDGGTHVSICDLTPMGHEFLANIKNDSLWKKVISKGVGASLPLLMELAKETATKYFLG